MPTTKSPSRVENDFGTTPATNKMNAPWLYIVSLVFLLPSPTILASSIHKTEVTQTKHRKKRKKIDKVIWLGLLGGSIRSKSQNLDNETHKAGSNFGLNLSGSLYNKNTILDLGISWWKTELSPKKVPTESPLDSDSKDIFAENIKTDLGTSNLSLLFRLHNFAIGPTVGMIFGTDSSFAPAVKKSTKANVMAGATAQYTFSRPTHKNHFINSVNLRYLTDLSIPDRRIDVLTLGLGFGFGIRETERVKLRMVTKKESRTLYKTKYKTRTKTIYKTKYKTRSEKIYLDKVHFYIDAGFINFETAKNGLSPGQSRYLQDLGKLLGKNQGIWKNIYLHSHTDKRGSVSFNSGLSKRRGESVASILLVNGLNRSAIKINSIASDQGVVNDTKQQSYARNRRVEILIKGKENMDELKSKIITLQQIHRMPSTCHGDKCI